MLMASLGRGRSQGPRCQGRGPWEEPLCLRGRGLGVLVESGAQMSS